MRMNKRFYFRILLFQALVCLGLFAFAMVQYKNSEAVETSLFEWKSDYITFDNGWYVDESIVQTDETIDLLYGPYLQMDQGSYSVEIDYSCDSDQSCAITAQEGNDAFIKSGTARLSSRLKKVSYRFALTEHIDQLELVVKYNGQGALQIHNVAIRTNSVNMRKILTAVFFLFLLWDGCVLFQPFIRKNKNLILAIGFLTLLSSFPLFMRGILNGHDLTFHLLRIEGIAEEMRSHNFPVRISSLWMDGYGYPVSVFYGDILLYLPAFFRLIGFPVIAVYKMYLFFVNLIAVIIAYVCFYKIFSDKKTALLLAMAYTTAAYRFVNLYIRSAVGEFSAMLFLPILALALYRIYTEQGSEWKIYKRNAWILAAGMSGLICTHILSAEMACFVLILISVVLWKKTFCKKVLRVYVLAALETAALSAFFIIPFLDYYINEPVNVTSQVDEVVQKIQQEGAYLGQYFSFFQTMAGASLKHLPDRMGLTPGIVLMFALAAAAVLWIQKKDTPVIRFFMFFSMFLLFLASDLFPWDHLAQRWRWGVLLSQVQFPWRYIGAATVFLTLLLGFLLAYCRKRDACFFNNLYLGIIGICLFMSFFYTSDYVNHAYHMVEYYDAAELDTFSALYGGQYLKPGTDTQLFSGEVSGENVQELEITARDGCRMELYCKTTEKAGKVEVPMLYYKGYQITDETGKQYEIMPSANHVIQFAVSENFSGKIQIRFAEPWSWKIAEWISAVSFLYVCAAFIGYAAKKRRRLYASAVYNKI